VPVRKFRSIEEMNAFDRERWVYTGDPRIPQRIRTVLRMTRGLIPPLNIPKGVHKFRSIEEMNAFKDRYIDERIALLRQRVVKK
jgi:hypothetical protein